MSDFSHLDGNHKLQMVDVSHKTDSVRTATAQGEILLDAAYEPAKNNQLKKGDLISIIKIAGIQSAKKTADLIPLCHQLNLSSVSISCDFNDLTKSLIVRSTVKTKADTGVEMEALTAVSVSLLTAYDMCKSVTKNLTIGNIKLLEKSGGKSGEYHAI